MLKACPKRQDIPAMEEQEEVVRKDRSLLYMGIGLGFIVLVMGYLTLFVDDPGSMFSKKEPVPTVVHSDDSDALDENSSMTDQEVRQSLVKFIEAYYNDQKKGYFDPPSYFAPITKTYFNFHNLTYKNLKQVHHNKYSVLKNFRLNWIVSSLDFKREGSVITATYWTSVSYIRPQVGKEESADIKYEMQIDETGKIVSLREIEIKNQISYDYYPEPDTSMGAEGYYDDQPGSGVSEQGAQGSGIANPEARYEGRLYDVGSVESAPEFVGGQTAMFKYFQSQLKYPAQARENKVQGKVYVGFVVEKNGSLSDLKVVRGIGSGCDEEALRILKNSPAWKPGSVEGKPVRTSYTVPVFFQLD